MDKISNLAQIASLRRYTLTEGCGKGLDVIDMDNGKIRVLLNVSKALDLMQLYHKGVNLSFVCKNGFNGRETSFANRFEGGMLYTCGLDSIGERHGFETHGSHHNYIANVVRAECNSEEIIVEAEISETKLFDRNIYFKRVVKLGVNSDRLQVCDIIENRGYKLENYCLLYHVNLGYPMLDEGGYVISDVDGVRARNDWANKNIGSWSKITPPKPCQEETCYYLQVKTPSISLVNEKLNRKFTLKWSKDTLPKFIEWKSMASGDYALGLEPTTTLLDDEFEYLTINAGEKKVFNLEFEITDCE